ncbi:MAG: DedA family protein [Candidatus Aenigmatarchaeota archaeon]|nr:DedA family protein [Candidatus Aenigmarchaeota archaeon]
MLEILIEWIVSAIAAIGYPGLFLLMAGESAVLPIPSEIVLPFTGYLVWTGRFEFWIAIAVAVAGQLSGSLLAYFIGLRGGRAAVLKYGHYIFLSHRHLEQAERWFEKWGSGAVFASRLLPAIRTVAPLPAGVAKMDVKKFVFWTIMGSIPWTIALTWAGFVLGQSWQAIMTVVRMFEIPIIILAVIVVVVWLWRERSRQNLAFWKGTWTEAKV